MFVYNVTETEFTTDYRKVEIEECSDNFISEDDFQEIHSNLKGVEYDVVYHDAYCSDETTMVFKQEVFSEFVTNIIEEFSKLPSNRKTVKCDISFDRVPNYYFVFLLDKAGYKLQSGRVRKKVVRKNNNLNKPMCRRMVGSIVQIHIKQKFGVRVELKDLTSIKNQEKVVKLALQFGLDSDSIKELVTTDDRNFYNHQYMIDNPENIDYMVEWFDSIVERDKLQESDL